MNDSCAIPRSIDETEDTIPKERSPTITSIDDVDWSLSDSFVIDWDDGHIPESLRYKQCDNSNSTSSNEQQQSRQYMRIYPKYHDYPLCCDRQQNHREVESTSSHISSSSVIPPFVYCMDDTIPIEILNALYLYTIKTNQPHSTWGTYITMEQIRQYWNHHNENHIENKLSNTNSLNRNGYLENKDDDVDLDSIVIPIAAHFIRNYIITNSCNQTNNTCCSSCHYPNLFNKSETTITNNNSSIDMTTYQSIACSCNSHTNITNHTIFDEAHGIAIWALASDVGAQVPYHIDYAELIRYETGIIVPPIIAGTLHCTLQYNTTFIGGDYCVIVCQNGIDHYSKHGYKGKLYPVKDDSNNENKEYIQIPYKFNRMICQSGHLPHWSTKVESSTSSDQSNSSSNNKRVIVGFNVFCHDVGPIIQQAPEHSNAFRKRVKQHRFVTKNGSMNMLSLNNIHTNPKLRRLLILAKREKKLNDFKCAQQRLYERICIYLRNRKEPTTVQQVLATFSPPTSATQWPYDVHDVHVFIHKCWKDGHLRIIKNTNERESKLIETDGVIELIE